MPSPQSSVLIVDDESSLRTALRGSLTASGYSVGEARNGEEALRTIQHTAFDLVLLDINMPGMSGLEACRRLREIAPTLAIVMVTVRELEDDKVRALEAGADDYITKPFRYRELTARLRAVLRRTRLQAPAGPSPILEAGSLKLDIEKRSLWRGDEQIRLSPTEFDLLTFFMRNENAPLTHGKLLRTVWGPEHGGDLEYLRSYVRMLRKKIEDDPGKPQYILTEPCVGYRFRNPSDPDAPSVPAESSEF